MESQKQQKYEHTKKSTKAITRIDASYIRHEIQHLLHVEKGFLFTVKALLLYPGKTIREFLFADRDRHVKPVIFLIFCCLVFSLITHYFHIDYSFLNIDKIEPLKGKIRSQEIGAWTNSHLGYTNLIMGVFIAIWIKIFFAKHKHNIFEILVVLCFVQGEAMLLFGALVLLAQLLDSSLVAMFGVSVYFLYTVWAIGQFFGERNAFNYLKSALTYVLGNITYLTTLILLAYFLKVLLP